MRNDPVSGREAPDSDDARIVRAAARWRTRQDRGLTAAGQDEFQRWLEADPRHAACFEEMAETWTLLDRVRELPASELEPEARPSSAWWRRAVPFAAAAAILLGWWALPTGGELETRFAESTPADAGALKRVNLPDGSVVRLRESTAIDVHFTPQTRRVRLLRGEAHFSVAREVDRPFCVETRGVGVWAVGTAFTVASHTGALEVLVTEGRVRVETVPRAAAGVGGGGRTDRPAVVTPVLEAGERAVVNVDAATQAVGAATVERLPPARVASAVAWQERMLDFDAAPLTEIVAQFNRFNRHQLVVADAALGNRRFGGSFRADDPDGFVALLVAASGIAVERREHETLIRGR